MIEEAQRKLGDALAAAQRAQEGAERYRRSQREARSGKAGARDRPRSRKADEERSPGESPNRSVAARVARLLAP